MNTRRANVRIMEENNVNEGVPQAQAMMAQANRNGGTRVKPNATTTTSRLRDFVRMNSPVFLGSKVGEEPQEFRDEVYKVVDAMGVTLVEKADLAVSRPESTS
uniref:Gag-pol polyprotein n=1 Tax=Solanum tuberosum TaxID=4113 RepID=M1DS52_SOLTU